MRQILFEIPWNAVWGLGPVQLPVFGWGWLLLGWWVAVLAVHAWDCRRAGTWAWPPWGTVVAWVVVSVLLIQLPVIGQRVRPAGLPAFGYGAMLLCGLAAAIWLAERRARQVGIAPDVIWDLAVWLIVPGIIGARALFLWRYGDQVYHDQQTLLEMLLATVALWTGGLVLQGSLVGGAIGYFTFCYLRKVPPLKLADVIVPSVFVGIGFGRLGCLLNGCCFGAACEWPWGIEFPQGSVPFLTLVDRGFLSPEALHTHPLHPTQLYSSFDGFLLAGLTSWYFRYRVHDGDVLGLGLVTCGVTRFLIEFLRDDEAGLYGTVITPAQWISVPMVLTGVALLVWLSLWGRVRDPATGMEALPTP
jgi:phosphatidylglycerol---prolipoprotein diacylglyceryl transferase